MIEFYKYLFGLNKADRPVFNPHRGERQEGTAGNWPRRDKIRKCAGYLSRRESSPLRMSCLSMSPQLHLWMLSKAGSMHIGEPIQLCMTQTATRTSTVVVKGK
ncbi:hypothetical protein Ahia01_001112000, partial [Argonauta hians]